MGFFEIATSVGLDYDILDLNRIACDLTTKTQLNTDYTYRILDKQVIDFCSDNKNECIRFLNKCLYEVHKDKYKIKNFEVNREGIRVSLTENNSNKKLSKGLILLPQWAYLILNGRKTWEVRSSNTKIRGKIGIIASKTGKIFGEVEVVDSFPLTKELFEQNFDKHRIMCSYEELPPNYKWVWVMSNPIIYDTPIQYKHPKGAIIWVNL